MSETVREDELHAYVDEVLPAARRAEVDAWLALHPLEAARVQAWIGQNRALRAAFDGVLAEPLPEAPLRALRAGAGRRGWPVAALAATLAVLASGLVGYGLGRDAVPDVPALSPLAHDAALAHAVFSTEQRHPVEVDAGHAGHLVAWLSNRLGTPLHAPDFTGAGFALLGGRLLAGGSGPVAQFMYQDDGERRVTLYVRRVDARTTAFRHATDNGIEVFYWIDGDFGYALSGRIARADMQKLADLAYAQLRR